MTRNYIDPNIYQNSDFLNINPNANYDSLQRIPSGAGPNISTQYAPQSLLSSPTPKTNSWIDFLSNPQISQGLMSAGEAIFNTGQPVQGLFGFSRGMQQAREEQRAANRAQIENLLTQAKINEASRVGGIAGGQTIYGKIQDDLRAGLITPEQAKAAFSKETNINDSGASLGGATGVLVDRYMKATGADFETALYSVQTGMRQGLEIDASGNIVARRGVSGAMAGIEEEKGAAKARGAEIGKKEGVEKAKSVTAPVMLGLIKEAKLLLPEATSGTLQNIVTRGTNFAGVSTKASEADARLDLLSADLTLNVPRMEGPQSNNDTVLYKQAAADIGNRNLPYKTRLAAIEILEKINKKYSTITPESEAPKNSGRLKFNPATGRVE